MDKFDLMAARATAYDFRHVASVPTLCDVDSKDPKFWFNGDGRDLFDHYTTITIEEVRNWSASAVPTAASANAAGSAIDRDKIAAAYGRVESSTLNADTAAVIGILKEALLN
eukprot:g14793.t1 g14793   contig90:409823-411119(-)